ncbi:MAG TPA: insulinase family protein [Chthonomonadales bacterium]|nr:insulinase family protein [Chthonomonadales bacterium]
MIGARLLRRCAFLLMFTVAPSRLPAGSGQQEPVSRVALKAGERLLLKPESGSRQVAICLVARTQPFPDPDSTAAAQAAAQSMLLSLSARAASAPVPIYVTTRRAPTLVTAMLVTTPAGFPAAGRLLCSALTASSFTASTIHRATEELQQGRLFRQLNPLRAAVKEGCSRITGTASPSSAAMQAVTAQSAARALRRLLPPESMAIAVVGDFDPAAAAAEFAHYLEPLNAIANNALTRSPLDQGQEHNIRSFGSEAVAVAATPAPAISSEQYAAFLVLRALLGGGHASRLFLKIRDQLGLGYRIGAEYQPDRGEALALYVQWRLHGAHPDYVSQPQYVERLLSAVLDMAASTPPGEAELKRAKAYVLGSLQRSHELASGRAFYLAWYEAAGAGYRLDFDLPARIEQVTAGQVQQAARRYFRRRDFVLAVPR